LFCAGSGREGVDGAFDVAFGDFVSVEQPATQDRPNGASRHNVSSDETSCLSIRRGVVVKVIVFGATGKTGRHVVTATLEGGHRVTAFGRSVDRLDISDDALETFKGDVFDRESVGRAVAGHDAAIVCLGSTGLRDKTTLATGTRTVVDAMVEHGADRLVVLSAAGVDDSWKQIPWSSRLLFRTMLRNVFADHHAQEAIVKQSPLDWTIVRAAVLKDDPATGSYTASNTAKIIKINRADVAACLVDQLEDAANSHQAISVTAKLTSR